MGFFQVKVMQLLLTTNNNAKPQIYQSWLKTLTTSINLPVSMFPCTNITEISCLNCRKIIRSICDKIFNAPKWRLALDHICLLVTLPLNEDFSDYLKESEEEDDNASRRRPMPVKFRRIWRNICPPVPVRGSQSYHTHIYLAASSVSILTDNNRIEMVTSSVRWAQETIWYKASSPYGHCNQKSLKYGLK